MPQGEQQNLQAGNRSEPLLNEYEYARIIKRSVHSVRRDRLLGQGCPYIKLIGSIRYRREDIDLFVAQSLQGYSGEGGLTPRGHDRPEPRSPARTERSR